MNFWRSTTRAPPPTPGIELGSTRSWSATNCCNAARRDLAGEFVHDLRIAGSVTVCYSACIFDADRRANLLTSLESEGHLWTPPLMQAFLRTVRGMWSGAVIYPAS